VASLFTLPADEIDADVLNAFLVQANPEAPVLEYKRELNDHVLRTIAAMANTLGGVILIGVPERKGTGLPDTPVGVPLRDRDRLVSQCFARFEPPFEPEIIAVPLTASDGYVLVVRVDPAADRPIVMGGTVYIRLAGQTQAADRYRMAALFAERGQVTGIVPTLGRPRGGGGHPLFETQQEALLVRAVVQTRVPAQSGVLDGRARRALADAVRESELERWLAEQTSIVAERQTRPQWVREGFITHATEALRRPAVRAVDGAGDIAGQAVVELGVGRVAPGYATLILDVGIVPVAQDVHEGELPYTLAFSEMKALIARVLQAAVDEIAPAVFSLLSGSALWTPTQTTLALDTGTTPITRYVKLPRWPRARNAEDRPGPFFETPPGIDPRDPRQRQELIQEWLAQMLYNQRFSDFDEQLAKL
jgi:hypothetical protein